MFPSRGIFLLLLVACVGAPPRAPGTDLLVVAPHPDDEVLMAGGTLAHWVKTGRRVEVVVMTNGDLGCQRDGWRRQRETVAALGRLGLTESHIHFLGYPDGALDRLGPEPLPPRPRLDATGQCRVTTGSYGAAGEGFQDEHHRRTGHAAPYTGAAILEDVAALLTRFNPAIVVMPHDVDEHPDHSATATWVRRALAHTPGPKPSLWRAIVHVGPHWPDTLAGPAFAPWSPLPPLPAPLDGYAPTVRWPVDSQAKALALLSYRSQLDAPFPLDWLASFARADEAFFVESPGAWPDDAFGALPQLEWQAGVAQLKVGPAVWRRWVSPTPLIGSVRQAGRYVEVGVRGSVGWVGQAVVPVEMWQPPVAAAGDTR